MATLQENINQAILDFDSIKEAIKSNGVAVPDNTPTSEYAKLISKGLPSDYTQVNYLEFTGSQYISNMIFDGNYIFEIVLEPLGTEEMNIYEYWQDFIRALRITQGGKINLSGDTDFTTSESYLNKKITIRVEQKYDNQTLYINDVKQGETMSSRQKFSPAMFNRNAYSLFFVGKVYSIQISDDKNTKKFVPCIKKTNLKAGFYESVGDIFYTNLGSGEFLYG